MPRSHRSGKVFPSEEIQGAWEVMAFGMVSEKTHKGFFQACSGHACLEKQFWGTLLLPVRGSPCGLPASLKLSSWGQGGGGVSHRFGTPSIQRSPWCPELGGGSQPCVKGK